MAKKRTPNPRKKPRGGQPKYVLDRQGKPIVGLSCSATDGRYYATHSHPRKWFGSDYDTALIRFREWELQQNSATIQVLPSVDPNGGPVFQDPDNPTLEEILELHAWGNAVKHRLRTDPDHLYGLDIPEDIFWNLVRQRITANPHLAAERTGLPLHRLHEFREPGPSPTLKSIGALYLQKASITPHERRKSKRYWAEFERVTRAKTLQKLTQEQIADYHDAIMNSGQSQTYIKHRFGKIKTILNFALKRGVAPEEIQTTLAYCKILNPPRAKAADPHPIPVADYHALLAAADAKWRAILLLALNCCMYGKEVADLEEHEIDTDRQILVTDRQKTGITRVACLWPETVEAIRQLTQHSRSYTFLSQTGEPYHPDHVRRGFARLRARTGVSPEVKFSDIRDGAYTAAVQADVEFEKARILAGHRTGMSDHYIKRNPQMVKAACEAIRQHYFGSQADS